METLVGNAPASHLKLLRELRAMGATRVRIGDFEVCFEPSAPSAVPDSLKDEPDESPLERQKRFDKTLFRSSG